MNEARQQEKVGFSRCYDSFHCSHCRKAQVTQPIRKVKQYQFFSLTPSCWEKDVSWMDPYSNVTWFSGKKPNEQNKQKNLLVLIANKIRHRTGYYHRAFPNNSTALRKVLNSQKTLSYVHLVRVISKMKNWIMQTNEGAGQFKLQSIHSHPFQRGMKETYMAY